LKLEKKIQGKYKKTKKRKGKDELTILKSEHKIAAIPSVSFSTPLAFQTLHQAFQTLHQSTVNLPSHPSSFIIVVDPTQLPFFSFFRHQNLLILFGEHVVI